MTCNLATNNFGTNFLTVGNRESGDHYIDGWVKEVVVFDSELGDDEIAHRPATALAGLD